MIPLHGNNGRGRESCQEGILLAHQEWPPKEEFADRFARLRRHKKLDNAAIAAATGVVPKTVSMWAGGQEPKGTPLLALARLLDVTPEYLLKGREEEPEPVLRKNRSRRITEADLDREEREEKKRKSRPA